MEPADLFIYNLETERLRLLVSDGSGNVNLPGSVWNTVTKQIVFSSSRAPHDEIFIINEEGIPGEEWRVTSRDSSAAYEPSFSPDGQWVVFESHQLDVEDNGVIVKYKADGSGDYVALTSLTEDCRQPNWSPKGDHIIYQRFADGKWDLWMVDPDGSNAHQLTTGAGDMTDASFSQDGDWIVYSSDENELEFASVFVIPISGGVPYRATEHDGYAGAPSWSPDGTRIAFEASGGDPDDSPGTTLWLANVSLP
jgi:TolB protein